MTTEKLFDLMYDEQNKSIIANHNNPLNRCGCKCFSQNEEDGITLEIIRRLGINSGTYIEFGVGNGLENNTLILAALGWKGAWVGAESLSFNYRSTEKHLFIHAWINLSTLSTIQSNISSVMNITTPDVFSVDLDGNDIYITEALLASNVKPKLWIVEYNAKFPPPVEFSIKYDQNFNWAYDDYFGASLTSYSKLMEAYDYVLVATNAWSGSNAFFVHKDVADKFYDVPYNINDLYTPPRYNLYNRYAFPVAAKTVEKIFGY